MAEKSNFNSAVDALIKGMDGFVTTKTVVGQPVEVGEVTIVPLADVSFGIGAGVFAGEGQNGKNNAGGGLSGKIIPSAVLVIGKDGSTRMVRTREKEDTFTHIVNMAPGIINRFLKKDDDVSDADAVDDEDVKKAAKDADKEEKP